MKFNSENLIKVIKILKKNGIIGLPTETVYGLLAMHIQEFNKKIFTAKKRFKKTTYNTL